MAATGRQTADERREAVLRAAIPEFATRGLAGTSTDVIAKRAGISQPYLFRLFPTKKELFVAAVERIFAQVGDTFERAAEGLTGRDALEAMGESYGQFLEDRDLLMLQMQAYAAAYEPDVCAATRTGFGNLWSVAQRISGSSNDDLREFFATGMLLNVIASLQLQDVDARWASDCIPETARPQPHAASG